ncbi:hypothetical protein [Telluria beijingensis]|uniref:hypothetical protein n=1 Tax=Telluria beijingensis TaxID=3068633 RepID=UPI002795F7CA|nr:hypothetical protein [Massilia sp. REN29]
MTSILSRPGFIGLVLIAATTLALVSVNIERRGPELVSYGNLCGPTADDPCHVPALKGGFPVAYLVDAPGISVERRLGFGEDTLRPGALVVDIAVYFAIIMAMAWAILIGKARPRTDSDSQGHAP